MKPHVEAGLFRTRTRRAYLLTKAGVFAAAAVATIPLAHVFGARAWGALVVFGLILAVMTLGVLLAARVGAAAENGPEPTDDRADDEPDASQRSVVLPVEDSIDLHTFPPRDIPAVVESYLETALEAGFREVRLIHGRGIGVQRERVRAALSKHPAVESFDDAPADRGGWGATVAVLSCRSTESTPHI